MTKEELAATLNGREIGEEITDREAREAGLAGLLVVFGASDDLCELRGRINDEVSAFDGVSFRVRGDRVLQSIDSEDVDVLKKYGVLDSIRIDYAAAPEIEAVWCDTPEYSWTFRTALPHASFDVLEGQDKFCRGIVIAMKEES